MKNSIITLAKHPDENRYLMCWYTIKTTSGTYLFRSDAIVTKTEEDTLHKIHCERISNAQLLVKCLTILMPYMDKIKKHIATEMSKPKVEGFSFPGPSVVKIK